MPMARCPPLMRPAAPFTLQELSQLGVGSVFGHIGMIYSTPSTTSVVSDTEGLLWQLYRTDYLQHTRPDGEDPAAPSAAHLGRCVA